MYPCHEVSVLPQIALLGRDEAFANYINLKRIQYGNRRSIKFKKFGAAIENLECVQLFLRPRKRDSLLVAPPKGNMVVLKTKVI
jgi:hypothetical protein